MKSGNLNFLGHPRPVTGLLYFFIFTPFQGFWHVVVVTGVASISEQLDATVLGCK